jgi:hypothetical protein
MKKITLFLTFYRLKQYQMKNMSTYYINIIMQKTAIIEFYSCNLHKTESFNQKSRQKLDKCKNILIQWTTKELIWKVCHCITLFDVNYMISYFLSNNLKIFKNFVSQKPTSVCDQFLAIQYNALLLEKNMISNEYTSLDG